MVKYKLRIYDYTHIYRTKVAFIIQHPQEVEEVKSSGGSKRAHVNKTCQLPVQHHLQHSLSIEIFFFLPSSDIDNYSTNFISMIKLLSNHSQQLIPVHSENQIPHKSVDSEFKSLGWSETYCIQPTGIRFPTKIQTIICRKYNQFSYTYYSRHNLQ